ncbi:hypothetical protein CSB37_01490 [bacterium DOLZORAL124_38_8]|nr:MAG: hypothetical protein CSB37_01490 [bacterium DOLZORAL124_38_8]
MNDLFTELTKNINGDFVSQIATKIGADESQTKKMIDMALPIITQSLAKNSKTKSGAKKLEKALEKKHDGSVLESVSDLIQHPEAGEGAGILKHVLGKKLSKVEDTVASQAGVDKQQSGSVLKVLAPMVMGALGKQKQLAGVDAKKIVSLLENANEKMKDPNNSFVMDLATAILDKDKDGDIKDDLLNMAKKTLQSFFKK